MRNLENLKKIFYKKKILITGHTGFKGTWLSLIFDLLGAKVYGISRDYPDNFYKNSKFKNLKSYIFDLSNFKKTKKYISKIKPDFIFHLAAQSIVSKSYSKPLLTWNSNLLSFLNILEALRINNKKTNVVMITSDKCYLNVEKKAGYKENEELGGFDNYSASKASCELMFKSYFLSYFKRQNKIRLATARAGNVVGGGDWSLNRLIPDIIKSIASNEKLKVRSLNSTRPWQHVLEPLSGYISLAINLKKNRKISGQSFNFGPNTKNYKVKEVLNLFKIKFKNFKWKQTEKKTFKESKLLNLNCKKAEKLIKWRSKMSFKKTIYKTIEWYISYDNNKNITKQQIEEYFNE